MTFANLVIADLRLSVLYFSFMFFSQFGRVSGYVQTMFWFANLVIEDFGFRIEDFGFRIEDFGFRIVWIVDCWLLVMRAEGLRF